MATHVWKCVTVMPLANTLECAIALKTKVVKADLLCIKNFATHKKSLINVKLLSGYSLTILQREQHIDNRQVADIFIFVAVKDPPRRMSVGLAFGAVSKTVYEHRRVSLERYLQVSFLQIT